MAKDELKYYGNKKCLHDCKPFSLQDLGLSKDTLSVKLPLEAPVCCGEPCSLVVESIYAVVDTIASFAYEHKECLCLAILPDNSYLADFSHEDEVYGLNEKSDLAALSYSEFIPAALAKMTFIENLIILHCIGSYEDGSLEFHIVNE